MIISLAPLQGYTEFAFRNALADTIGGVDKFYTPFLRFENDGSIRSKYLNDIKPENNKEINLVPQILVNNSNHFLELAKTIEDYGYTELNWNLGCPYPMVAKRKLGSGLLEFHQTIETVLNEVIPKTKLDISIKLRSGYENNNEVFKVIKLLNFYPIKEVIYHPRIGKQLYKGAADYNQFLQIQEQCELPLAYNGDIDSVDKYNDLIKSNSLIKHAMIGRGLISNPFLAQEIKGTYLSTEEKQEQFSLFHKYLYNHYKRSLSGNSHLLNKMVHFWEYFSHIFTDQKKTFKSIKKCKNIRDFENKSTVIIQTFNLAK